MMCRVFRKLLSYSYLTALILKTQKQLNRWNFAKVFIIRDYTKNIILLDQIK